MIKRILTVCISIILCGAAIVPAPAQETSPKKAPKGIKKICITFDNLPSERIYSRAERFEINNNILAALKKHKAPAAGFVIGDNIEGDWEVIVRWLDAGHTIGFLPYSGQDIENVPADMFMSDVAKGKDVIEGLLISSKQKGRYFRYPYLHYGSAPEVRKRIEGLITEQKIKIAHASIVTEDFVYNLTLEKLMRGRDTLKIMQLRDEYIEHLLEKLGHAESLAMDLVNRPVRHILQFRTNRLNAMFLDDILAALVDKGYGFITLKDALKDKVYKIFNNYYGPGGLSYLERLKAGD